MGTNENNQELPPTHVGESQDRGKEVVGTQPEQSEYSKALDGAERLAQACRNNPERQEELRQRAADVLAQFGANVENCNQYSRESQGKLLNVCNDVGGDAHGTNIEMRIGKMAGQIADGLRANTLSVEDAAVMLAFQMVESTTQDALNQVSDASAAGARGVSRNTPEGTSSQG